MKFAGHLDLCGPRLIEGWLYCDFSPATPVRLQVWVGDTLLGECSVDRFRLDLKDAGFGDGFCGFSFPVPETAADLTYTLTRLRLLDAPIFLLPSKTTVIEAPEERQEDTVFEGGVETSTGDSADQVAEVAASNAEALENAANDPEPVGAASPKVAASGTRGKASAFWKKA